MAGTVTADLTLTDYKLGWDVCNQILILISMMNSLSPRYYKTTGVLPPTWKYESSTASTLVA